VKVVRPEAYSDRYGLSRRYSVTANKNTKKTDPGGKGIHYTLIIPPHLKLLSVVILGEAYFYLFIYLEIHSFIYSTREILKTSVCSMKSERHHGNELTETPSPVGLQDDMICCSGR